MSKYNLFNIVEGMSNAEFRDAKEQDRLEAHPDRYKIKIMQNLLKKEKEEKEGKEAVDLAVEASQEKAGIKEKADSFVDEIGEEAIQPGEADLEAGVKGNMNYNENTDIDTPRLSKVNSIFQILTKNKINNTDIVNFIKTHKEDIDSNDIDSSNEEDVMMNYNEFFDINSEDFSDLKEHFSRFLKDYQ
jgi:hypothetical protein